MAQHLVSKCAYVASEQLSTGRVEVGIYLPLCSDPSGFPTENVWESKDFYYFGFLCLASLDLIENVDSRKARVAPHTALAMNKVRSQVASSRKAATCATWQQVIGELPPPCQVGR